ncbi:hypothetical protein OL229_07625 [Neisseriaceae bacterium JH1-16]|nr:hypothetical protein [Neisseriaceae bacterium JH1-16]
MTAPFGQRWPKPAACLALLWWLFGLWCLFKPAGSEPMPFLHYDKLGHFGLFAVQAVLLYLAAADRTRAVRLIGCSLAVWAGLSELLQATLIVDRSGDPWDALADLAGAGLGLALGRGCRRACDRAAV